MLSRGYTLATLEKHLGLHPSTPSRITRRIEEEIRDAVLVYHDDTREEIEEEEMSLDDAGEVVIPFGKHKGKCLYDVPLAYIKWLSGRELYPSGALKHAVEAFIGADWFERELRKELDDGPPWEDERG